jgi:hypothetical protein
MEVVLDQVPDDAAGAQQLFRHARSSLRHACRRKNEPVTISPAGS